MTSKITRFTFAIPKLMARTLNVGLGSALLVVLSLMGAFAQSDQPICDKLADNLGSIDAAQLRQLLTTSKFTLVMECDFTHGFTLLHIAVTNKQHPDVVDVLVELGADLYAEDDRGRTPIYAAVDASNPATLERLFQYGDSYLHVGFKGRSALSYCEAALVPYPSDKTCLTLLALHESRQKP